METINITLKIDKSEVVAFENWLHQQLEVISFNHIRDTSQMYKEDATFKKLVKAVKEAQRVKDDYAIKNNNKYLNK
jgi:uncharacterized protein involved in propanediol utilization